MPSPTRTLDEQRALCNDLADQWRRHVKICGTCPTSTARCGRFCDDGWNLARDLLAAKERYRQQAEAETDRTPPLF